MEQLLLFIFGIVVVYAAMRAIHLSRCVVVDLETAQSGVGEGWNRGEKDEEDS
ncbi:MAG: hypothetical protein ACE5JX_22405 [Acidobacteriota bacterium]